MGKSSELLKMGGEKKKEGVKKYLKTQDTIERGMRAAENKCGRMSSGIPWSPEI